MVAYAKSQQMKKEESEILRGERDKIKMLDERGAVIYITVTLLNEKPLTSPLQP